MALSFQVLARIGGATFQELEDLVGDLLEE